MRFSKITVTDVFFYGAGSVIILILISHCFKIWQGKDDQSHRANPPTLPGGVPPLPPSPDDLAEMREDWNRISRRAIPDAGVADQFTGRLRQDPRFEYSDKIPDAADDFDLRRDAGASKPAF